MSLSAPSISRWCGAVIDRGLALLIFFLPLFFLPWTQDIIEVSKQTLLILGVSVIGMAWAVRALMEKRLALRLHWIHGLMLAFVLAVLLSTITSQALYQSLIGIMGQTGWSLASVIALTGFVFFYTQHVRSTATLYHHVFLYLCSSLVVAIFGLFQILGIYLIPHVALMTKAFTTVGSPYALAIFLVPSLVLASLFTVHQCKLTQCVLGHPSMRGVAARYSVCLLLVVGLVDLFLVDYWAAWLALLAGVVFLMSFVLFHTRSTATLRQFLMPGALCLIAIAFLFLRTPIHLTLPAEVSPAASASWDIARSTLQTSPWLGSGPSTFVLDYSLYRSPSVTMSPFWQARFDYAFSTFFTLLATIGLVGIIVWLALFGSVIAVGTKAAYQRTEEDDAWFVRLGFVAAFVSLCLAMLVYPLAFASVFLVWFLFAALLASIRHREYVLQAGPHWKGFIARAKPVAMIIVFALLMIGTVCRMMGEILFQHAVENFRASGPIDQTIGNLEQAERWFDKQPEYTRNLSQAYLIQASQMLAQHPTTDEMKNVELILKQAVDAADRSVAKMPAQVDNWANKATVHEQLASAVKEFDQQAIDAFQQAKLREPSNPIFDGEIGKLMLLRADTFKTLKDPQMDQVLQQAKQALLNSVRLKPDYFPAHFYLGMVYERLGKVPEAIVELEQVLRSNSKDVGVAFELAILYYRDQQAERAIKLMEQVVAFDPSQANARWYLSSMYLEKGMIDPAITQLQALSQQMPGNQAVAQRLTLLKQQAKMAKTDLPEPLPESSVGAGL